jgi:Zn-dependent peptidase ImmA (M78 family)
MTRRDDDEIERIVNALRIRLGIAVEDQPDMAEVLSRAKALGIIKDYVLVDYLPNAEAKYDPDEQKIFITKRAFIALRNGSKRERFTIAHELGHDELDHSRVRYRTSLPRSVTGKPASRSEELDESEANRFAAAFLCPSDRANYVPGMTADQLAEKFDVSLEVARIRLEVLKRMYYRKNRIPRPLPKGVVDFLKAAERKGRPSESLELHERTYGKLVELKFEGEQCPNPACREFTLVRHGTYMQCARCNTKTGDD